MSVADALLDELIESSAAYMASNGVVGVTDEETVLAIRLALMVEWADVSDLCRRVYDVACWDDERYRVGLADNVRIGCAFVQSGLWSPFKFHDAPYLSEWHNYVKPYQDFQRRRVLGCGGCDAGCGPDQKADFGAGIVCRHTNRACVQDELAEPLLIAKIIDRPEMAERFIRQFNEAKQWQKQAQA